MCITVHCAFSHCAVCISLLCAVCKSVVGWINQGGEEMMDRVGLESQPARGKYKQRNDDDEGDDDVDDDDDDDDDDVDGDGVDDDIREPARGRYTVLKFTCFAPLFFQISMMNFYWSRTCSFVCAEFPLPTLRGHFWKDSCPLLARGRRIKWGGS